MSDNTTTNRPTLAQIIDTPEAFGIAFTTNPIAKGVGPDREVLRADAPMVEMTDSVKFRAAFGEALLIDCVNGSSLRVKWQAPVRDRLEKNPRTPNNELRDHAIRKVLLGETIRSAPTTRVVDKLLVLGLDGQMHPTLTELTASNMAWYLDNGMDAATARSLAEKSAAKAAERFPAFPK